MHTLKNNRFMKLIQTSNLLTFFDPEVFPIKTTLMIIEGTQYLYLFRMKQIFLLATVLVSYTLAQDTYHCPDGWTLEEDSTGCRCFLLSGSESVTKRDAEILCDFHDGAWVSELDHPGINYWLKSQLLKELPPGEYGQFWLGAETEARLYISSLKIVIR